MLAAISFFISISSCSRSSSSLDDPPLPTPLDVLPGRAEEKIKNFFSHVSSNVDVFFAMDSLTLPPSGRFMT